MALRMLSSFLCGGLRKPADSWLGIWNGSSCHLREHSARRDDGLGPAAPYAFFTAGMHSLPLNDSPPHWGRFHPMVSLSISQNIGELPREWRIPTVQTCSLHLASKALCGLACTLLPTLVFGLPLPPPRPAMSQPCECACASLCPARSSLPSRLSLFLRLLWQMAKMATVMYFPCYNPTPLEGDFPFSFIKKWNISPPLEGELDL